MAQLVLLLSLFLVGSVQGDTLFGGERTLITVAGHTGFVIQPPLSAANGTKPWAWYAPTFIDQYPNWSNAWYFSRLIQQGIWVCGVDLGESYGSPAGRAVCSAFYDTVVARYGLKAKVLLVPQSRGGLMLYNWAADNGNAAKVSRIAGIYPVGDLRSYPGLVTAAPAYGMTSLQLEQQLSQHNPIDRLQPLYQAGVKIMHVHGDNDAIVPLSQNSQVVYDRYVDMGGSMTLIVVPGQGHAEIPQFFQSQQMLDFMLEELVVAGPAIKTTTLQVSTAPGFDLAYPTPFSPGNEIALSLQHLSKVTITIFDASGRQVAELLSQNLPAGRHFVTWNAEGLPGGTYICRIKANHAEETGKIVLQK